MLIQLAFDILGHRFWKRVEIEARFAGGSVACVVVGLEGNGGQERSQARRFFEEAADPPALLGDRQRPTSRAAPALSVERQRTRCRVDVAADNTT